MVIRKYLFLLCLISFNVLANSHMTRLSPGVSIYSEYYQNSSAKFKGTIIFENGSGTDITEWKSNPKFFNCVMKIGSVFLYDRNGLGKSPADVHLSSNNPITAKLVSDKLAKLLTQLHIKPPYILVTHSYGAIYSGYFTLSHPNLVKAIIMIDPVPKNFEFSNTMIHKYAKGLQEAHILSSSDIYKKYGGSKSEVIYQLIGFNESKRLIKQLGIINDRIPVIIISSTGMEKNHPLKEDWYESQKQWLNKNPLSKITQIYSDHFVQLKHPQTICNAIKSITNQSNLTP
jgi:pimeloyl-ACP methyl ester carboxylesterase